jgi:hypothetical protein
MSRRPARTVNFFPGVPRGMSKETAAAYAGCKTPSAFNDWIRRGIMPGPIPGTHRWDKKAIDLALDRLSGLEATIAPRSPFDEWMATQNANAGERPQLVKGKAR